MAMFLYVCGGLLLAWSALAFGGTGTVMGQIYSGTTATAGAVFIVGGAIVGALVRHADTVKAEIRKATSDQRWENIETCLRYLVTVKDQEGGDEPEREEPAIAAKMKQRPQPPEDQSIIQCENCGTEYPANMVGITKCPECGHPRPKR